MMSADFPLFLWTMDDWFPMTSSDTFPSTSLTDIFPADMETAENIHPLPLLDYKRPPRTLQVYKFCLMNETISILPAPLIHETTDPKYLKNFRDTAKLCLDSNGKLPEKPTLRSLAKFLAKPLTEQKSANQRCLFQLNPNTFLAKKSFTFGKIRVEPDEVHFIQCGLMPIKIFKHSNDPHYRPGKFNVQEIEKHFTLHTLEPHTNYILPSGIVYILLCFYRSHFSIYRMADDPMNRALGQNLPGPEAMEVVHPPPPPPPSNQQQHTLQQHTLQQHTLQQHTYFPYLSAFYLDSSSFEYVQSQPNMQVFSQPAQPFLSNQPSSRPCGEPRNQPSPKPCGEPQNQPSSPKPCGEPQNQPSSPKPCGEPRNQPSSPRPCGELQNQPSSPKPCGEPQNQPSSVGEDDEEIVCIHETALDLRMKPGAALNIRQTKKTSDFPLPDNFIPFSPFIQPPTPWHLYSNNQ